MNHQKIEEVKSSLAPSGEITLDVRELQESELPSVTIVTITKNKHHLFPLAIDNWKRTMYPEDKIFWLIIDESHNNPVKKVLDDRINLIVTDKVFSSIGEKRNYSMQFVKTEYTVIMDDDDFLFSDSI